MATVKWASAPVSRGNVLTTELGNGTGLANLAFSAPSPAYDNTVNLDRWGWVEFLSGGSITPTAGAYISIYLVHSPGGTNYDDPASATDVATHQLVAVLAVQASAHQVRAINSAPFALPPGKFKFVLKNGTGVALTASGNTVAFYTGNEAVA